MTIFIDFKKSIKCFNFFVVVNNAFISCICDFIFLINTACWFRKWLQLCWIVWAYSGAAHGTEAVSAYVIFRLLILDEPAQALPFRRNSGILIYAHKSLLINGRWKEREEDKTYENFENKEKRNIYITN